MLIKKIRLLLFLLTALFIASCGYRLSGTGGIVPEGAASIAIPVFLNGVSEPYIDVEVTQAVTREFLTDGRLKLTDSMEADLVLRGVVAAYEAVPLSYTADSYVQQYRIRLVVNAVLEDRRAKKILWQEKGIEAIFISDYAISYQTGTSFVDIQGSKMAKEAAIRKAARDIAWTLRSRVLEGF